MHCVYTIYADDLEAYTDALTAARNALTSAGTPRSDWPDEVRQMKSVDGTSERQQGEEGVEQGMDPAMSAFLA